MNQTREIKNFIFSQYFADGVRISLGVLLPALLFAQAGHLDTGIILSLGAIGTSIPDNPGAVIYKRNAMLYTVLFMGLMSLVTGLINQSPFLLGLEVLLMSFFFSMFNVFGNRAASIGTSALLIMIVNIDRDFRIGELMAYTGYLMAGGIWYMGLSLAVSQFRPYRIAQNTLGECIVNVAQYLSMKADFYDLKADLDATYNKLIDQQIIVHQHQDNVREILFRNNLLTRDQTNTGRLLVLVFVDVIDLFERMSISHYDYKHIREQFADSPALAEFHNILSNIADQLTDLGDDINVNERPRIKYNFQQQLEKLKTSIDATENNYLLKKILINVRVIVNRINTIYSYFNHKELASINISNEKDLGRFVSNQQMDPKVFIRNMSLKSTTFRHALRVSIVCLAAYLISKLLPLGHHSYWILLTVTVLLKPGFSLTKQRNYQRMIGTLVGGIAGAVIVYYINDEAIRFAFLIIFMLGAYSFQRKNYIVSVLFLTPYILISFSFMGLSDLSLAKERILDTFLGSLIAFISSYFLFPSWESYQMNSFMRKQLIANYQYLAMLAERLRGLGKDEVEYKLKRKEVYVSTANMSSAYQRMLSEPRSKQKNVREASKFLVLNHKLYSYAAILIATVDNGGYTDVNPIHFKLLRKALFRLWEAIELLKTTGDDDFREPDLRMPTHAVNDLDQDADDKLIREQLDFVNNTAADILATARRFTNETAQDDTLSTATT